MASFHKYEERRGFKELVYHIWMFKLFLMDCYLALKNVPYFLKDIV